MDPTKPKDFYTAKRESRVDTSDPSISEAWEKIRSNEDPLNWALLSLLSQQPTCVTLKVAGSGGISEMIQNLSEEEFSFGVIRVLIGGQPKFFQIYYVGENVSGIKRGKASLLESGIFQGTFEGTHGKIQFNGLTEFTPENLRSKLQKLTSSDDVSL
jgi:hypothetical protein